MGTAGAGNEIALEINTRLAPYSIALYAILLMGSNLKDEMYKFCSESYWLQLFMAVEAASIMGKDLLLVVGTPFLDAPVPPADLIALTYQVNVLFMPTLAPVCLWFKRVQWSTSDALG